MHAHGLVGERGACERRAALGCARADMAFALWGGMRVTHLAKSVCKWCTKTARVKEMVANNI